ncbi:MAG TPA: chromosomal replication initiator protein DnaA [Thermoanaerobaculia bacterium]|nr:chromosomal replication initiator protein DnaA [Thermoanaerobaculia bacterium]
MSQSLWSLLQKQLQQQLDPDEYATWFRPLRVHDEAADRLVLLAPNSRFLHTLEESYRPTVDRAIAGVGGRAFEVLFSLEEEPPQNGAGSPAPEEPPLSGSLFNPKYQFQNFVEGKSNEFALAAARRVAENPSLSYNPLFLYGGVGLGKTHLLNAIGHEIQRSRPQLKVLYLVAEQFVNELINSIRFDRMPAFRERYRTIDVLMIDDVQFIANKERTQEEFFHTFNTLYTSQKQIILSSDSSPRNIPTLEERLRSRFEWGLIADIQAPDLETKMAILQRKAGLENVSLPYEVADFIASQVKSNIRELEGHLNRVIAYSSLTGKPLSLALARETLKDVFPEGGKKPAATEIIKAVARHYDLKIVEIKSKNNSRQIVIPRQVAMYLCKRLTDLSYPDIGKLFGDKHHSTVMYSVDTVQKKREADPDFDRVLQAFEQQLT